MNNINYITIFNLVCNEYSKFNTINTITFINASEYKTYFTRLTNAYFYQIATVTNINGVSHIINMQNVKSISETNEQQNSIEIEFIEGDSVFVMFDTAERLSYELQYLKFIYECNNFNEVYKYNRKIRVSPDFSNSNSALTYNTINAANDVSQAGDVIHVYPGEYSESVETLNNRIYYFEDGAVVTDSGTYVLGGGAPVGEGIYYSKVFGRGEFVSTDEQFNTVLAFGANIANIERNNLISFFVECKELSHPGGRVILIPETILKCDYIHNESEAYAVYDTDAASDYTSISVIDARLMQSTQNEYTFHQDSQSANYVVKNATIINDAASGTFNNGAGAEGIITKEFLECCFTMNEDLSGGGVFYNNGASALNIELYNCVLEQTTGTYSTQSVSNLTFTLNLYSQNYFTKTFDPDLTTINQYNSVDNYQLI